MNSKICDDDDGRVVGITLNMNKRWFNSSHWTVKEILCDTELLAVSLRHRKFMHVIAECVYITQGLSQQLSRIYVHLLHGCKVSTPRLSFFPVILTMFSLLQIFLSVDAMS